MNDKELCKALRKADKQVKEHFKETDETWMGAAADRIEELRLISANTLADILTLIDESESLALDSWVDRAVLKKNAIKVFEKNNLEKINEPISDE